MKNLLLLIMAAGFVIACSRQSTPVVTRTPSENLVIQNDEDEYELIIIDPQFQTWFITNARPIQYYSKNYYEAQNRRYVTSWNELYQLTGGSGPFGNYIDYRFTEDYGIELNYQLFWYFRYVQAHHGSRYNFPT